MGILAGKPFYVCITTLTGKPVKLPTFMIVATAFNAPPFIIHAGDGAPFITGSRGPASMQRDSTNSVHGVHYKPPKRRDEQVYRRNAVKILDGNANLNW